MKLAKDLQVGDEVHVLSISNEIKKDTIIKIDKCVDSGELVITYKSDVKSYAGPNYPSGNYGLYAATVMFSKEALLNELSVRKKRLEKDIEELNSIIEHI